MRRKRGSSLPPRPRCTACRFAAAGWTRTRRWRRLIPMPLPRPPPIWPWGRWRCAGCGAVRLRAVGHAGAGQGQGFVLADFARQAARIAAGLDPPRLRVGALDRWRDLLDVADVCAAYVAALQRDDGLAPGWPSTSPPASRGGSAICWRRSWRISASRRRSRPHRICCARPISSAPRPTPRAALALLGWRPQVPFARTLAAVCEDWRRRVAAGA